MKALNIGAVTQKYAQTLHLDEDKALEMAKLTKGYPFAFQVLGYLTWNNDGDYTGVIPEYRQYLEEYVVGIIIEGQGNRICNSKMQLWQDKRYTTVSGY